MAGSPKKRARRQAEQACTALMVIPQPEAEKEPHDRWGRPTKFKPEYVEIVRIMCEEGATNKEIAARLNVHISTFHEWLFAHPELAAVCKFGKELANDRLERTAYEVAMGYTTTVKESLKLKDQYGNEKLVTAEKEIRVPPDPRMLQWMLKNRRPDTWRDRTEQHIVADIVDEQLTIEQARERVKALLIELRDQLLDD